jgi:hypothetical protein
MRRFTMRKIIGFILMAIIGVLLFGNIVMWLWNALMPVIFHLPIITFPQALGLLVLSKILFSSFRGGGPGRFRGGRIREKWMDMTPEEREKFKQEWGHRRCRPFEESGGRFDRGGRGFGGSRSSEGHRAEGGEPAAGEKPAASE